MRYERIKTLSNWIQFEYGVSFTSLITGIHPALVAGCFRFEDARAMFSDPNICVFAYQLEKLRPLDRNGLGAQ